MTSLKGRTLFISGASRGIGEAIAVRAAQDGANIALLGKSLRNHPRLPGTLRTAADAVEAAGGNALICKCDIRSEEQVQAAVEATVEAFGGIDIVVNNASAIFLAGTAETPMKRFDLMHSVNVRGSFLVTQKCLPHLHTSNNPHVLNMAPPLNMDPHWFKNHVAYSIAKYGMSMCVLGMAEEFQDAGIAVNALWPKTAIATAAVRNILGGEEAIRRCRKPSIVAEAAHRILIGDSAAQTGRFLIDEDVLRANGETDFDHYAVDPSAELFPDYFL